MQPPHRIAGTILLMSLCLTPARADEQTSCGDLPDPLEKLVCSSPALQPSYAALLKSVAAAQAALSEKGRAELVDGQRFWRAQTAHECAWKVRLLLDRQGLRSCLEAHFAARTERIGLLYHKTGPFQFSAIEYFKVNYGDRDDFVVGTELERQRLEVAYPQIDSPQTSSAQRWNKAVAAWVQQGQTWKFPGYQDSWGFDVSVRVLVAHAEAPFISLTRIVTVGREHAHPDQRDIRHLNIWIESGAALQPSDLFDPRTEWAAALRRRVMARAPSFSTVATDVVQAVDPINWSIEPAALTIDLNHGRYGAEIVHVAIPWRDLKAYLVSPVPLELSLD